MFFIPELRREVNIVVVGILKSLDLIPESIKLLRAECSCFIGGFVFVYNLAARDDRLKQLLRGVVCEGLLFPGEVRVKEGEGSGEIYYLIGEGDKVRLRLSGLVVKNSVNLFVAGSCGLFRP